MCDNRGKIYGYFRDNSNANELVVIVEYKGDKKNHTLTNGYVINDGSVLSRSHKEYIVEIGEYEINETVKIYYNDIEISNIKLNVGYEDFKKYNKITFKN